MNYSPARLIDPPSADFLNVRLLDQNAVPMLCAMEQKGMLLDPSVLESLDVEIKQDMERLEAEIFHLAGKTFEIGSDDQFETILFNDLDLPTSEIKRTKSDSRFSVGEPELKKIEHLHPIIPARLDWSERRKLRTSFVVKLPYTADSDGRIRCTLQDTRAVTGRVQAKEPNLMQIPKRSYLGKLIRRAFIAPKGRVLLAGDYSQIELRILAHLSGDARLIQAYTEGLDLHYMTASAVFGKPIPEDPDNPQPHEVSDLERTIAKSISFGVVYGITGAGLLAQVWRMLPVEDRAGWTLDRCEGYIKAWFEAYPGAKKMMQGIIHYAQQHGYVVDMGGRIRRLDNVRAIHRPTRSRAERQAGNMPIQGSAAAIMKLAMAKVWYEVLPQFAGYVEPLIQIHDDLVDEADISVAEEYAEAKQEAMQNVVRLKVPVKTSSEIGWNWGDMEKLEFVR